MKRLLRYVAYAALGVVLLVVGAAYAFYRSLLPPELPARPTTRVPPLVRGVVRVALGEDGRAVVARLHLFGLEERHVLPHETLTRWRMRVLALDTWLRIHFSADEVVDAYAERVPIGGGRVGLAAGAQALFGKPLHVLAPHEAAVLAGAAWAPERLDPACHPEDSRRARDAFLGHMADAGLVEPGALSAQRAMPVRVLVPCREPGTPLGDGPMPRATATGTDNP